MQLQPAWLDIGGLAGRLVPRAAMLRGNFVCGIRPHDPCWNEASAGATVRWSAGHVWSEPFLERLKEMAWLRTP